MTKIMGIKVGGITIKSRIQKSRFDVRVNIMRSEGFWNSWVVGYSFFKIGLKIALTGMAGYYFIDETRNGGKEVCNELESLVNKISYTFK